MSREDIYPPDDDDCDTLLHFVESHLPTVLSRPAVKQLVAQCGLSDDEVRVLMAYKLEHPFPLYRWLNAQLVSDRRDPESVAKVGPLFTLLFRAIEKLPRVVHDASRAILVRGIPVLSGVFNEYKEQLPSGKQLCFWGFSSFTTDDSVMNNKAFVGGEKDEAIVYSCSNLSGSDMEPFKPEGLQRECELLPLAPALFTVLGTVKVGAKLVVSLQQLPNEKFLYVAPKS
jgi:hypothetical protein